MLQPNGGNVGIGTTSPYAKLSVVGPVVAEYFHATSTSGTSTIPTLSVQTAANLFGTFGNSLDDFCTAITGGSGLCDGDDATGGGASFGQSWELFNSAAYLAPTTTVTVVAPSILGVGTTSPWARLSVGTHNLPPSTPSFVIASSSTGVATSTQFIVRNGLVGIGATSPIAPLSVVGGTSSTLTLTRHSVDAVAGNTAAAIDFRIDQEDTGTATGDALQARIESRPQDAWGGSLAFYTKPADGNSSGSLTERMRILYDGNVGIGTTTPQTKLNIHNGNLVLTTDTSNNPPTILLHMDGADGSTLFLDEGGQGWTAGGNAQIDTAQSKFGGASALFDNAGDYMYTLFGATTTTFAPGDFTIDLWVRPNTLATTDTIIGLDAVSTNELRVNASGNVTFTYSTGASISITCNSMITTGSWQHIAIVRSGSTATMYDDGTSCGSDASAAGPVGFNVSIIIGNNWSESQHYDGWIDEVRLIPQALWTADFTAPTSASTPDTTSAGYIGIGTTTPRFPIHHGSDAHLSAGGSWVNASDRNLKTNFTALDPEWVLGGINTLNIERWNYKVESPSVMHVGPVAQDFFAQFGLGGSDTSISTVDASGVALVGIQALSARLDALASTTLALDLSTSTLATTTASTTPGTFASHFFRNLFSRITAWLADAANGIVAIFTQKLTTQELCVDDICVTRDQFAEVFGGSQNAAAGAPDTHTHAATGGTPAREATPATGTATTTTSSEPAPITEDASTTPPAAADASPIEQTNSTGQASSEGAREAPDGLSAPSAVSADLPVASSTQSGTATSTTPESPTSVADSTSPILQQPPAGDAAAQESTGDQTEIVVEQPSPTEPPPIPPAANDNSPRSDEQLATGTE